MKKYIVAIAILAALSAGETFAQRAVISGRVIQNSPRDNAREEFHINKLDNVVSLTRKQENKIKKIENKYDRIMSGSRVRNYKQLAWEKQKEIMAVLTPVQRQRWMAYQNNAGYGRFHGRG